MSVENSNRKLMFYAKKSFYIYNETAYCEYAEKRLVDKQIHSTD
ncbi:hypothetical protein PJIAN_3596 [Paludibacter jiangxiensis]|uniref:Uncharacterized protein n=1 Tax=Paludibacter jiangxiensis TaxID=681398 RepID=A0A161LVH9_9BACT|nr:hypothetical protein PJIAN_3596 [Paludibacter jiangxiensis]